MNENRVEILLVEDNADDVELALRAFKKYDLGHRIHVTRDGVEALQFIFGTGAYQGRDLEHGPKVILLDLKLPRLDGLEVLRRLKADPRTRNIPVVALTSSQEDRDVAECYRLGVNSYIVKPVDFDRFADAARILGMYWLTLNRTFPYTTWTDAKGKESGSNSTENWPTISASGFSAREFSFQNNVSLTDQHLPSG